MAQKDFEPKQGKPEEEWESTYAKARWEDFKETSVYKMYKLYGTLLSEPKDDTQTPENRTPRDKKSV